VEEKLTEDTKVFGENVWVYCNQHLRPHLTGWCTVSLHNKVQLDATNVDQAFEECKLKGFKLYGEP
jgi:hypothetical protein